MNLVQLEQLVEIARQKTLSAAAESLHLSQPALSRSMKKLEADLQLTLFTRTKNSMQLNDTGELAVQHAETVLQAVADMRHSLQEFERKKRTIAVGSCAPAPLWKLLPFLANLYPDATISSEIKDTPQIVSGLKTGQYQIAVLPHRLDDEDFLTFKICKEHLFLWFRRLTPSQPQPASPSASSMEKRFFSLPTSDSGVH